MAWSLYRGWLWHFFWVRQVLGILNFRFQRLKRNEDRFNWNSTSFFLFLLVIHRWNNNMIHMLFMHWKDENTICSHILFNQFIDGFTNGLSIRMIFFVPTADSKSFEGEALNTENEASLELSLKHLPEGTSCRNAVHIWFVYLVFSFSIFFFESATRA